MEEVKNAQALFDRRSISLPTGYTPVGWNFRVGCRFFDVVVRPEGLAPHQACSGCYFSSVTKDGTYPTCPNQQCSSWDRLDKRNVWFVESTK